MTRKELRRTAVMIALVVIGVLGVGLYLTNMQAKATTGAPGYDIILEQSAPNPGRPAPYGQWIVTHNAVSGITTTQNYGTIARTNGYDLNKVLFCENTGSYTATVNLYGRTTSTGSLYNVSVPLTTVNPSARVYHPFTKNSPWMSLGITSTNGVTGTTMTCGIFVQTP